jgi:hypothetical protein
MNRIGQTTVYPFDIPISAAEALDLSGQLTAAVDAIRNGKVQGIRCTDVYSDVAGLSSEITKLSNELATFAQRAKPGETYPLKSTVRKEIDGLFACWAQVQYQTPKESNTGAIVAGVAIVAIIGGIVALS